LEINISQDSITEVLQECEDDLLKVIRSLDNNPKKPASTEAIMTLCSAHSAIRTIRMLCNLPHENFKIKEPFKPPASYDESGLVDDNPDEEDKDLKQQREDNRPFFSR